MIGAADVLPVMQPDDCWQRKSRGQARDLATLVPPSDQLSVAQARLWKSWKRIGKHRYTINHMIRHHHQSRRRHLHHHYNRSCRRVQYYNSCRSHLEQHHHHHQQNYHHFTIITPAAAETSLSWKNCINYYLQYYHSLIIPTNNCSNVITATTTNIVLVVIIIIIITDPTTISYLLQTVVYFRQRLRHPWSRIQRCCWRSTCTFHCASFGQRCGSKDARFLLPTCWHWRPHRHPQNKTKTVIRSLRLYLR